MRWLALLLPAFVAAQVPTTQPATAPAPSRQIASLTRILDVSGTVTREVITISFKDGGEGEWYLPVEFERAQTVSLIEITEGKGKVVGAKLFPIRGSRNDAATGTHYYGVDLPANVKVLTVTCLYTHWTQPLPDKLGQEEGEKQGMLWSGDLLGGFGGWEGSLADDVEVNIKIKTPTPKIYSQASSDGFSVTQTAGSSTVLFTNRGTQFSTREIGQVHYHQPAPVISISNFTRLVEVSHWGANLAIEDTITLVNSGPKLKGPVFSRLAHQSGVFMRKPGYLAHTLTSLTLMMPPGTVNPYYIDTIGNVSTSRFRPSPPPSKLKPSGGPAVLELVPRYPIVGGWEYNFRVGFDVAGDGSLRRTKKGEYIVHVPMLSPMKDVALDDVTLRVRLPEGAKNVRVVAPFPVDHSEINLVDKTFLDTTGRPTILLRKKRCTDRHAHGVFIVYTRSSLSALQKPAAISAWMLALFLSGGLIRRFEWKI